MRVVLHTPRVYVEEVWVPCAVDASDAELMAAARTVGTGIAKSIVDTGSTFVYSRGEDDLAAAGRRIADTKAEAEAAMAQARLLAVRLLDAELVSEREATAKLGLDRGTVRGWRGKARPT